MSYRILLTGDVKWQLKDLPGHMKALARQQIANLAADPRPPRCKELAGHPGHYRLRLGAKYRLVWQVQDEDKIVEIEYVGPKAPDLYDKLGLARPGGSSTEDD